MIRTLLFHEKDIKVYREEYGDFRGVMYSVLSEDAGFSDSYLPTPILEYDSLRLLLDEYKREKGEAYAADDRGGDNEIDFWANFDTQTEAF